MERADDDVRMAKTIRASDQFEIFFNKRHFISEAIQKIKVFFIL